MTATKTAKGKARTAAGSKREAPPAEAKPAAPKRAKQRATAGPFEVLLAAALAYPDAWKDHPWGENVAKVGKKVFAFFGVPEEGVVALSVKLPASSDMALSLPFVQSTGYGLGKSGWVTARFAAGEEVPTAMLLEWIDESYRAVAPKTLVKALDARIT
jgi:predicted DNA-binding protein (MmcQ/YjbR family)